MTPDFKDIVPKFRFEGVFLSAGIYGTGHIHDTYALVFQLDRDVRRYILQRINQKVFKDPEGVQSNIQLVTAHLRRKIIAAGGDPQRETLNLILTLDGSSYYRTVDGDYWRSFDFVEGARTYDCVENPDHVYNAAKAFGNFQNMLSDFPAEQLVETIPNFHHTGKRYQAFLAAVESDSVNRAPFCQPEIDFVTQRAAKTSVLTDMLARDELPERVTHNDTKFNNVMIDDLTGEGICIVDLDTVMPGLSLYDFGDAIRSMATTAAEDEADLSRVNFDLAVYRRYAHGYLDAAGEILTPREIEQLPFSAILMTFECGMRFLTDHLEGDTYYKIHRQNHNLDRCRTQFKLVSDMEKKFDTMTEIIEGYRQEI
ncbi:MAG TPA: aminoglycoside phosphotransferase family protein [Anaerolineales bacterium]|nr:aminoglycoside phosphotransferase family protein [Anaerolineales bacterium]